jgi:hypothetical protein
VWLSTPVHKYDRRTGKHLLANAVVAITNRSAIVVTAADRDAVVFYPSFLGTEPRLRENVGRHAHPEAAQPPSEGANQGLLPAPSHRAQALRPPSRPELAPARLERLLPSRMGSQASPLLARLLRVVEHLSLATQEASAHVNEEAEGDVSTYPPSPEPGMRSGQWHHHGVTLFVAGLVTVEPYHLAWSRPPLFAIHHGEPGA